MTKPILAASVSLALAILATIASTAFINIRSSEESSRQILRSSRFLNELEQLRTRVRDAESSQLGYVATGDRVFLQTYEDVGRLLPALIDELSGIAAGDAARQRQLRELAELVARRHEPLRRGITLRDRGEVRAALKLSTDGPGRGFTDRIDDLAAEMKLDEEARQQDWTREARATARVTLIAMASGSLLAMALLAVAAEVVRRQLAARAAAQRETERFASELARKNAELTAANEELESFSYSVSHDLRVPLRAIDGYSRMLQEDIEHKLDDEDRRKIGVVRDNAHKMGQLIDDLLQLSWLGRKPLEPEAVDMRALADECYAVLQEGHASPLPPLRVGELREARGDRAMLRQVLLNLLSNAVKFTSGRDEPRIEVGSAPTATGTEYWVHDNGAGFDMQYVGKLFGVFQRLHGQRDFPGTGVGLAIVKRVVNRHGGTVRAEGRVDEGATFYFHLPGGGPS